METLVAYTIVSKVQYDCQENNIILNCLKTRRYSRKKGKDHTNDSNNKNILGCKRKRSISKAEKTGERKNRNMIEIGQKDMRALRFQKVTEIKVQAS